MEWKKIKEQFSNNIKTLLILEYLGIRLEDTINSNELLMFYFSVPESSTLELENEELDKRIKTSYDLIQLAKDLLIEMTLESGEIFEDEEFLKEVETNISSYCKFYAKVRKGEMWNEEKAKSRVSELRKLLSVYEDYKEV